MLKARSLTYHTQERNLIHDISLDFLPGILYGVLGPNGSGKSTLLKTLSGIWEPTSGQVFWHEEDLLKKTRHEISQTISLVPQNPQVQFEFSVRDFVSMGTYTHQRKKKEIVDLALTTVNMLHLQQRGILSLSSGERQRAYIARSLVTEAPVMLLDEPTATLDIRHQLEIWRLLKMLANQGKTIIVTLHDLPSTARFCDQIAVLDKGKCIAKGDFDQVMRPHLLKEVFGVIAQVSQPAHFSFDLP